MANLNLKANLVFSMMEKNDWIHQVHIFTIHKSPCDELLQKLWYILWRKHFSYVTTTSGPRLPQVVLLSKDFFFLLYIWGHKFWWCSKAAASFFFCQWMNGFFLLYIGPQVGLDDVAYTSMEKGKSLGLEIISQFYVGVTEFDWWRKNRGSCENNR